MNTSVQKEALFNEVKGSLFEFLIGQSFARTHHTEKEFLQDLDRNYLNVLTQQDRMVRQFYPEMGQFLQNACKATVSEISRVLGETPQNPKLLGKLVNSQPKQDWHEADLLVEVQGQQRPISLKLNKKGAFVNTKSGGIKSFFQQYFSFLPTDFQSSYNQLVDLEFDLMSRELHESIGLKYPGNFSAWVAAGHSELPGELPADQRKILKAYYSRLARKMHDVLTEAKKLDEKIFFKSLFALMGFSSEDILQVICFHDFKKDPSLMEVYLHDARELSAQAELVKILPFGDIASVEISIGTWSLQVRIKPMNKFTTTAIKINCSVKVKQSSDV